MSDLEFPVADLSAVHDIVSSIATPHSKPQQANSDGEATANSPQSNHLEPRQFSKIKGLLKRPAEDAMTMGSGVA
jgi:hypothetical protein